VDDIGLDLVLAHRVEMVRGDDPLAKLLQAFAGELFAELGLAEQEDLEQRAAANLIVGEHAQLFERRFRQVLRLVDDQKRALAASRGLFEMLLNAFEKLRFFRAGRVETHALRGQAQHVRPFDLGGDDVDRVEPGAVDRAIRCATRVDLPAPTSPVMTMKPSPCASP
jgi:hypothetical protein